MHGYSEVRFFALWLPVPCTYAPVLGTVQYVVVLYGIVQRNRIISSRIFPEVAILAVGSYRNLSETSSRAHTCDTNDAHEDG